MVYKREKQEGWGFSKEKHEFPDWIEPALFAFNKNHGVYLVNNTHPKFDYFARHSQSQ